MVASQEAAVLRVLGQAALDLADVLDAVPVTPTATAAVEKPKWEIRRINFLRPFMTSADETLSLTETRRAARAAGMKNSGSLTSHGYIEITPDGGRRITELGKKWLASHDT
jgi:hypothetical protein